VTGASSFPDSPARTVTSRDGTPIAVFTLGSGPPLILVHGTTADHLTWRVSGPLLAERRTVHAIDRRGRGASGDGPDYAISREYEDVAAVASAVVTDVGVEAVPVVGHSLGGRIALGAADLTPAISKLVVYEGAPPAPGEHYEPRDLVARLRALVDEGRPGEALATFMHEVVRMPSADLEAFRSNPIWPLRVAAAHTIVRELEAAASPPASLEALSGIPNPVLQILGGSSAPVFGVSERALDARLADGRIVVIEGARHAAHHTHAGAFVAAIEAFLAE
jgi:pimeloyl-ACP methyl ester carboxylesterase